MSGYSGGQNLLEVKKLTEIQINWLEDFFFFNCCKSGKNLSYDTGHN